MKLPADALHQLRDGFWTLADDRGIHLLSNTPEAAPALSVAWPLIGLMRVDSLKRVPIASRLRLDLVMIELGIRVFPGSLVDFPVLCIPVTVDGRAVELRVSCLADFAVARQFEKRRPRPNYCPMLQWIPD